MSDIEIVSVDRWMGLNDDEGIVPAGTVFIGDGEVSQETAEGQTIEGLNGVPAVTWSGV